MPVYIGLPKEATIAYQSGDIIQYKIGDEWIYEFGEWKTINGEWQKEHTGIWFTTDSKMYIYKGLTTDCPWKQNWEAFPKDIVERWKAKPIVPVPPELVECLKHIKERLHKNPDIHIGWYAKNASLEFFYKGNIFEINSRTLDFDEIDFRPAYDFDKEHYEGGAVGNEDAYFEHNERIMRAMLNDELGIVFFHGHGDID